MEYYNDFIIIFRGTFEVFSFAFFASFYYGFAKRFAALICSLASAVFLFPYIFIINSSFSGLVEFFGGFQQAPLPPHNSDMHIIECYVV